MSNKSRTLPIIGSVVAGVAALALVALFLSPSSDEVGSSTNKGTSSPVETGAVTVTGEALPQTTTSGADPAIGRSGPALSGTGVAGEPVEVRPGAGPMLLVFGAHWCPHCQAEFPRLVEAYEEGLFPQDLEVVAVSTAVTKSQPNYPPSAWLAKIRWPYPVLVDSSTNTAAKAYGISGFPFSVLLDADGRVVARHSGEFSRDDLEAFLAQLR